MGTKWDKNPKVETKNGNKVGRHPKVGTSSGTKDGNKVGTLLNLVLKYKNGNKVGTKWEQKWDKQEMGKKWKQS